MKVSDYIIDFFAKLGVEYCFVVSGGAAIHLIESCFHNAGINYICSQHEQNAAAAADLYARMKGLGLAISTSGPGATNMATSICNAYFDSSPLVCLTGQVARFRLKRNSGLRQKGFQETDVVSMFKPVTKYAKLVENPLDVRYELEKAVYWAQEGRAGPVLLDVPDDLQREDINPASLKSFSASFQKLKIKPEQMDALRKLVKQARKPVIIAGAGIHYAKAEKEADRFFKKMQIPVLLTWGGKDLLAYNDPLNGGCLGICGPRSGNFAVQQADLIIALGTRLSQMIVGGKPDLFAPYDKKVLVDIDSEELHKFSKDTFCLDLALHSHLSDFFKLSLKTFEKEQLPCWDLWKSRILYWKKKYAVIAENQQTFSNKINPHLFIQDLFQASSQGQILIGDTGANLCWTMQSFEPKKGQKIFSAWNHTPMGFALPASVGAAFASGKEIICLIGDGGLMMCLSELGTVSRYRLPVKIFVFNNQGHGLQKHTMDTWMSSHYCAADVKSGLFFPEYENIAKAFKIPYFKLEKQNDSKNIISRAMAYKGPVFCDVKIFEGYRVAPMLKFGAGLEDLDPKISALKKTTACASAFTDKANTNIKT